ncbi:DUF2259 domain-containing protein [Algicella marina]|nr:DUF2259 domain-containing protein [Algicella marina]
MPAFAGDAAHPQAIGFSDGGERFAFLEWGQQDGSGFGYASVFIVDLERDAWVVPPVRSLIEDEAVAPMVARQQAWSAAADALGDAGIHQPARLVHSRPFLPAEKGGERVEVAWRPITIPGAMPDTSVLYLETFALPAEGCEGETAMGFALMWKGEEIARDVDLPESRGCPTAYSIERIYASEVWPPAPYAVALIGVFRRGFEGPDLRHIALPIPLKPAGR